MNTNQPLFALSLGCLLFAALLAAPSARAAEPQDNSPWMLVTRDRYDVRDSTTRWTALVPRNGGLGIFTHKSAFWSGAVWDSRGDPSYRQMVESWRNAITVVGGKWLWREDGSLVSLYDPSLKPLQLGDAVQFATVDFGVGYLSHLALKQDGTVVSWDRGWNGVTPVSGLSGIKSLAAGMSFQALRDDGALLEFRWPTSPPRVLTTGLKSGAQVFSSKKVLSQAAVIDSEGRLLWTNINGLADRLKGRKGIKKILFESDSALFADGTYLSLASASLLPDPGRRFPVLHGVTDVLINPYPNLQQAILDDDGTFYLLDAYRYSINPSLPWNSGPALDPAQHRPTSLSTDFYNTYVTADVGDFGRCDTGSKVIDFTVFNAGQQTTEGVGITLSGRDASLFSVISHQLQADLVFGQSQSFQIRVQPTGPGLKLATLTISSTSHGVQPYVIPLRCEAVGSYKAVPASKTPAPLTFGPLHEERQTGLMVQTLTYTNNSNIDLPNGLEFTISKLPVGAWVLGGKAPFVINVVADHTPPTTLFLDYTAPVNPFTTITFTICYSDLSGRLTAKTQPSIASRPLSQPVMRSPGQLGGTSVRLLRVMKVPQGNMLEWNAPGRGVSAIEYSDDGQTWWAANTALYAANSRRMIWIDRGQPETESTPVTRLYRIKVFN